ncbi:tyrosine-type recombinase/integrase [Methylophaga sp.]|uniref:tyrosine-type recombinase/integrase n=2 Tax=Piscirickettsiaceae TaxID=135616 RepID=UPI0030810D94
MVSMYFPPVLVVTLMVTLKVQVVTMALTDIQIRNAKPEAKQYKLSAGLGLYLIVSPKGGKWWRFRYRFGGKQKELSLGTYPTTTLKSATLKRDEMRKMIADDIDPAVERKTEKLYQHAASENSFQAVADEWFSKFSTEWSEQHKQRTIGRLKNDVYPWLGEKVINNVTAPELLMVLRRMESRGAIDSAHRVRQICSQIIRYAIATGRAERDPAADLVGALPPSKKTHFASITEPKAIGELMRALQNYQGSFITACALRLTPYVFVRPGELRQAEWNDIDLDNAEWRIPAERMKMKVLHIIPLSRQALAILREIQPLTGKGKYVFPSNRTTTRPMSNNTINASLRRLGYTKEEMTAHGFRSMASTILNEQGWNPDAIERQLAHSEKNGVRAAYNYAQYLPERKKMMQSWADYLDGLASGAQVISIGQK